MIHIREAAGAKESFFLFLFLNLPPFSRSLALQPAAALWRLLLLRDLVEALFHLLLKGLGEGARGLGELGLLRCTCEKSFFKKILRGRKTSERLRGGFLRESKQPDAKIKHSLRLTLLGKLLRHRVGAHGEALEGRAVEGNERERGREFFLFFCKRFFVW